MGKNRSDWHREAPSTYTWTRTNRGPLAEWLHKIKKVESSRCRSCGADPQSGEHVVFYCPSLALPRRSLLLGRSTWEEPDTDIYIKEEGEEEDKAYKATQEFFTHIFRRLTF